MDSGENIDSDRRKVLARRDPMVTATCPVPVLATPSQSAHALGPVFE